uniref:Putative ovule protein n=1 Tax=Solanum chacoense TaxID=4108 RepID=A0A0V0HY06_SOLCH
MTGSVSMKIVGDEDKKRLDEDKVTGDGIGISREGINVVKDNELKINMISNDRIGGREITLQAQRGLKLQEQQYCQVTSVCWQQFLHVTSIKVLLVENDDSTRHVVSALLRNCNYEVIEAANGLQAWKILENLTTHIDLVLTEVVMPCLSGLGLLTKIMSHYTRKTVPVIMMSSHDSMDIVFKCLSKGALDFLVKPIRKNELKNLWQHVWRRCHSVRHHHSQYPFSCKHVGVKRMADALMSINIPKYSNYLLWRLVSAYLLVGCLSSYRLFLRYV